MLLEYFGYLASLIILISLVMSSILKLRIINLIGSTMFMVYGFMINSIPTGFMNAGIVIINIYYLVKIYSSKEYFELLDVEPHSNFLKRFIDYHKGDLIKFSQQTDIKFDESIFGVYILRNMITAGIFVAKKINDKHLEILIDFATPQYRDFKIGQYLFKDNKDYFISRGYNKLIAYSTSDAHTNYLKKMGFNQTVNDTFELNL